MRYRRIRWLLALLLATMVCRAQTSIDLTENTDGTWTLDAMPAYNVKLIVEYEDDLSQAIDLTDNGDGTWTLDQMPAYNVKLVVEYEDDVTLLGDVDRDGEVTAQDASLVQQHVAGKTVIADESVADADRDGDVTAQDASLIQQKVAGKISW